MIPNVLGCVRTGMEKEIKVEDIERIIKDIKSRCPDKGRNPENINSRKERPYEMGI